MRWDRGIFNGSYGFQWDINSHQVSGSPQEVQNTVGTMSSEQLQSTRRSTCPKMGVSSHGAPRKDYCFPIKNGVFLEDWNGSPFFKEPSNMLFYNERVTLQMCQKRRNAALQSVQAAITEQVPRHRWQCPGHLATVAEYIVMVPAGLAKVETQELHKDKPNANRHEACCIHCIHQLLQSALVFSSWVLSTSKALTQKKSCGTWLQQVSLARKIRELEAQVAWDQKQMDHEMEEIKIPAGKLTKNYWKSPFIVDLPMKNSDFP